MEYLVAVTLDHPEKYVNDRIRFVIDPEYLINGIGFTFWEKKVRVSIS